MNVLVTGSNGFIGRHLVAALQKHPRISSLLGVSRQSSHRPAELSSATAFACVGCDLKEAARVAEVMKRFEPDVVFHFAGNAIIKADDANPCEITRSNVLATHHLLDFVDPGAHITAGEYARLARQALAQIKDRGHLPVIVGGTGLYLRALLEGQK